ncbi:MAG: Asp-tRNA(Asn)/Glu-tRNA(Gln) amidotransferase subunit GatA [Saprospiraceae bacterium]|nr:Asp-tRNA(Asn)/Glu-tRNA(Gln) amidotransferase subunit GatA [Saprospiraceae bacterium]
MTSNPTIQQQIEAYASGATTCKQVVEAYISKIQQHQALNAFVEVFADEAIERASELDNHAPNQPKGRLHGIVIGLKDNICYAGHKVEAASNILKDYVSPYSATVVDRLLEEGAIIIGRLNCDEFAMGSSNENSAHGPAKNPVDPTRVPGGSSGGSAAAVKAGLCHAALGSSTGGSIRQPASFCGVVGVKPTYGRVSRYGLIAYGSSLDQIGTLTLHVEDAALLLEVIAGGDDFDATASQLDVPKYSQLNNSAKKYSIAYYPQTLDHPGLNPDVKRETEHVIEQLRTQGHRVKPVEFPLLEYLVPTYYIICTAEASSNLSRFDGVRYGHRSQQADNLDELYKNSRSEGFGAEVKRRILLGTFVLSSGYYDAYYTKAQKVRRKLLQDTEKVLENHDFIISPVAPTPAFKQASIKDPVTMYLEDVFTVQANLTGMPAVSVPLNTKTLPIGVQFMANKFQEKALFDFSNDFLTTFARP